SIFGRRRPAGRTVVQYVGTENGTVYFSRQSVAINSNETTTTRTPIFIPHASGNIIIPPRPHSESQVGLAPVTIGVKVGGVLHAEGHTLRVLRVNSDGSIDYAVASRSAGQQRLGRYDDLARRIDKTGAALGARRSQEGPPIFRSAGILTWPPTMRGR